MNSYDAEAKCWKCGHDDIATSYCDGVTIAKGCWKPSLHNKALRELPHMHRCCLRCHWHWYELPLDEPPLKDNK